jgi:hypothetical protein
MGSDARTPGDGRGMDAFERRERIVELIGSGVSEPAQILAKLQEELAEADEQQLENDLVALQFSGRIFWNAYRGYQLRGIAT